MLLFHLKWPYKLFLYILRTINYQIYIYLVMENF